MKKKFRLVLVALAAFCMKGFAQGSTELNIVDGVVQISTAEDLYNFTDAVNAGQNKLDAILLADIVMGEDFLGIGSQEMYYEGNFDGNFHKVTMNSKCEDKTFQPFGFIRCLSRGSVRNLHVDGEIHLASKDIGGIVGWSYNGATIQGCWSSPKIYSTFVGDSGCGGVVANCKASDQEWGVFVLDNIFDGELNLPNADNCAGIMGWAGKPTLLNNNIYIGQVNVLERGCRTIGRNDGNCKTTTTNYYLNTLWGNTQPFGTQISAEQFADGSLCFSLNGTQDEIRWYQNLGEDKYPVPSNTHKQVYTTAQMRCDGKVLGTGSYTNDASAVNRPDHQYVEGFCESCGGMQENYMTAEADGSYNIADGAQYKWIVAFINQSENKNINLRLTADVTTGDNCGMINEYRGTFDGQGHTLNYQINANQDFAGMIAYMYGAVKNIILDGTLHNQQRYSGAVAGGAYGLIQNVISRVKVSTSYSGDATTGSIVGRAFTGTYLKNILAAGSVASTTAHSNAGVVGWCDNAFTMENVAFIGSVDCGNTNSTTMARCSGNCTFKNCYYLNPFFNHEEGSRVTKIAEEEIANGSLCYKLNGNSFLNASFFQTIGTDAQPVLDNTRGLVYAAGETYGDVHDDASFQTFVTSFTAAEKAWAEELYAQKTMIDAYSEKMESLKSATSMDDFIAAYTSVEADKNALKANVDAYAKFQQTVETYYNNLLAEPEKSSALRDELRDYLETEQEPSETYANGTATYIYMNRTLNTADLQNETAYIETMWKRIKNDEIAVGSDITDMITNANFSNGTNGWQGNPKASPWGYSYPNVIESWRFNSHTWQVLDNLKNGVYMVSMNGMFRPGGNNNSHFYASYLYANDQMVPLQYIQEDLLPKDQAVDYQNCLISQDQVLNDCYYANSGEGMHYAVMGGRYPNHILVNVTDGKLELGVICYGTGMDYDWTIFGNTKLVYCGEIADADANLSQVLNGQVARANSILNTEISYGEDYKYFPNFSNELKDQLRKGIEDAGTADTPEKKYELINTFSLLFPAVYKSQQAYIHLMGEYEAFNSAVAHAWSLKMLDETRYKKLNDEVTAAGEAYINGTFTTEQAAAWKLDLFAAGVSEDGYYLISDMGELAMFSAMVGGNNLKGRLNADFDEIPTEMMMDAFYGELDGAFHTITLKMTAQHDGIGLINKLYGTVKNLIIKGEVDVNGYIIGGAIAAYAYNGSRIENCENYTSLTSHSDTELRSWIGGYVGHSDGLTINNCLFGGSINGGPTIVRNASFIGDCEYTDNKSYISNSLYMGQMNVSTDASFTFSRNPDYVNCSNLYYTELFAEKNANSQKISGDQMTSGELCYLLNMGEVDNPAWYQTLGEDAHPTLNPTHKIVYKQGDKYANEGTGKGPALITSASQLSSNASDYEEGQHIEYLIDGDPATFWHTDWHGVCQDAFHYLQVALNEQFTGDIKLEMTRRNTNGNNHPTKMLVSGSKDGVEFTDITTLDLPFAGVGTEVSATFYAEGVNYLRFTPTDCCTGFNKFWHCAEFQLYGDNTNAISNINAQTISKGIYNLSGQRMSKAQKGLNIIDGKKVLVK